MWEKLHHFLERDNDITSYDEWHYIGITFLELSKIIIYNVKRKLL